MTASIIEKFGFVATVAVLLGPGTRFSDRRNGRRPRPVAGRARGQLPVEFPRLNGKVERTQRADLEEFWAMADPKSVDLRQRLDEWQHFWNCTGRTRLWAGDRRSIGSAN